MKIITGLVLFVFLSSIIAPTVICAIVKDVDESAFYSFSDEEKNQNKIMDIINFDVQSISIDLRQLNTKLIFSVNSAKNDKICSKIFIPPPE